MDYESLVRNPHGGPRHQLIGTPSKITLHEPNDIKPMFQTMNVEPSDKSFRLLMTCGRLSACFVKS